MAVAGIVAEYNPFHNGHLYQIEELRRRLGEETPVVIAMSGDFVQRGEAAVFSKFARAEAAVRCGASLVLELPLPWSLSSAEGFARGSIGLLASTGVVDTLVFGSESGRTDLLLRCAEAAVSPAADELLRVYIKEGISFAAARQKAVEAVSDPETAGVLSHPNDLLAVEYIKAGKQLKAEMKLLPILRQSSVHDGAGSASDLRGKLALGETIASFVPEDAFAVYAEESREGRGPLLPESLRLPILSRLRALERVDFAGVPDAAEGVENKLFEAARTGLSPEAIAETAKSKRYALSRLRRMVMCAALGVRSGMADGTPPYIRVLAMDDKGKRLLREMDKCASVPVIVKPAAIRETGKGRAEDVFALGAKGHDLYVLGFTDTARQSGDQDWKHSPYVQQ